MGDAIVIRVFWENVLILTCGRSLKLLVMVMEEVCLGIPTNLLHPLPKHG